MKILFDTLADKNSFGEREPLSLATDNNFNELSTLSGEMFTDPTEETNSSQLQNPTHSLQKEFYSNTYFKKINEIILECQ